MLWLAAILVVCVLGLAYFRHRVSSTFQRYKCVDSSADECAWSFLLECFGKPRLTELFIALLRTKPKAIPYADPLKVLVEFAGLFVGAKLPARTMAYRIRLSTPRLIALPLQ